MNQYKNFISLGYFCSVALELERIGLRNVSSPFDWCISNYIGVIKAIENKFEDYLNYDYLLQSDTIRSRYYNEKYRIWFFHDFDKYHSLKMQLPKIKEKYNRRIDRFFENIKEPTLFVRYISDEELNEFGKSKELEWIEANQNHILSVLKAYNENNEVIYIANEGVTSQIINIYNVRKDENDLVARRPLDKNSKLNDLFVKINYEQRYNNIKTFNEKMKKRNNIFRRLFRKSYSIVKKMICLEYVHDRVVSSTVK